MTHASLVRARGEGSQSEAAVESGLLVPVGDASLGEIVGGKLQGHAVTR
jgi:hypothetical protein